jgi:GxxExxY protein
MTENDIPFKIRRAIFKVYDTLGPSLYESVYASTLYYELTKMELKVQRQRAITIHYKDIILDVASRIDLLVYDKVIIELKSIEDLASIYNKRVI